MVRDGSFADRPARVERARRMTAGEKDLRAPVIVVTRDEGPDGPLTKALEARGARVIYVPTIAFEPAPDPEALDRALSDAGAYDWIVFTSPRAVEAVCSRPTWTRGWRGGHRNAAIPGTRPPDPGESGGYGGRPRVAAAGRSTAETLSLHGVTADIVAEPPGAAPLASALTRALGHGIDVNRAGGSGPSANRAGGGGPSAGSPGPGSGKERRGAARILWPRSDIAHPHLTGALRAAGADVVDPIAYRTVKAKDFDAAEFLRLVHEGRIDGVTFLSPSSAEGLAGAMDAADLSSLAGRTLIASIGPTTSAALASLGAPADVESAERTAADLAAAVLSTLAARRTSNPGSPPPDRTSLRKERPR